MSIGLVSSFLGTSGIYNEDFLFFDTSRYGNVMVFLFAISFGSIYHARTFIPR